MPHFQFSISCPAVARRRRGVNFLFGASRRGYILLITVLIIGAISSAILSSLLMLGTSANQVSFTVHQASQALAQAQGCAEYALLKLRTNPLYAGNEVITMGAGMCEVLPIGGIGNNNRLVCAEGQVGDVVRRLEIVLNQVLPKTTVFSWQEVSVFSLCQ